MQKKRTLGCLALVVVALVLLACLVYGGLRGLEYWQRQGERALMTRQFDEIRQGKSGRLYIVTLSNFDELLADPPTAARVKRIECSCDTATMEWHPLRQLPNVKQASFYCGGKLDRFLEGVRGMQSLEEIHVSGTTYYTDRGMASMPSFTNL